MTTPCLVTYPGMAGAAVEESLRWTGDTVPSVLAMRFLSLVLIERVLEVTARGPDRPW